jgi:hypothetical protein
MSHQRKVWVVIGYHYGYDENASWVESVWTSKKSAEARVAELTEKEARRRYINRDDYEVEPVKLNTPDGRLDQ